MDAPILDELRRAAGIDAVRVDDASLEDASGDKWFARARPDAVVFGRSTAAIAAVMKIAAREGIPVTTRGAGHGYVGGCVPVRGGIVLSTMRMDRIKEISPADFVAVVEPGVTTGRLQAAARAQGLFYPPDPASLKDCSIGGNIATNAGGPRCLKYGVTRPYVLGLEVVLADGTMARVGGRTHKNKTGFDLVGLFTGSEGMLGIVTEATLRLLPAPPARAVLSASFPDMACAAAAVQAVFAQGHLPSALEIADRFTLEAARRHAGGETVIPPGEAHVLVEIDGQISAVKDEVRDLHGLLTDAGAVSVESANTEEGCEALWALRRTFSSSLKATGLKKLNEDIAVPRGKLVELVRFGEELGRDYGVPVACFGHAGDGNIHVNIMVENPDDPATAAKMEQALDKLFHGVLAMGGVITGEHGIGLAKKRWWPQAVNAGSHELHRRIKTALDPHNLLNPGKFLDG
ncbi:MAG: FAD-binding protein [Chthoniobacterales bacterium]|nr:FAD-binding protein [Chthoniobacterales bacterium]